MSEQVERIEVTAYREEWFHLHGKSLSGLRHSHPLKDGEDVDEPAHWHEGADAAIYPQPGHWAYPADV